MTNTSTELIIGENLHVIKGKKVILVRLDAPPLELGHRYSVFGRVIDKFGNDRAILIPFVSQAKE